MAWEIKFEEAAFRELKKLEKTVSRRILDFLEQRISKLEDPRSIGQALKGVNLGSFWKYRVGDYRIICDIQDDTVVILVVRIGNRREVYR